VKAGWKSEHSAGKGQGGNEAQREAAEARGGQGNTPKVKNKVKSKGTQRQNNRRGATM
jgi:hypothetical protein